MRAYRRLRKVGNKLEDQKILVGTINSVLMGTGDVKQQSIERILDEVISKVVKTEPEHRSQSKKKEVLTSTHGGQVLFNFCNKIKYLIYFKNVRYMIISISHIFYAHEIYNGAHKFNRLGIFISHGSFQHEIPKSYETNVKGEIWWSTDERWRWRDM